MSKQGNGFGTCVFIDENLEQKKIGILSVAKPISFQQIISRIREKFKLYDEIKWTTTSKLKVPFYEEIIDSFFWYRGVRLNIFDITTNQDAAILHGLQTVHYHCRPFNGIFIDNHSTPKGYNFEDKLITEFKCGCVMRLDSKSTDILQVADLMMNVVVKAPGLASVQSEHKRQVLESFERLKASRSNGKIFINS